VVISCVAPVVTAIAAPSPAKQPSVPAGVSPPAPGTEQYMLNDNANDGVAAVVNDSIISDYDLRQRVALFLVTSGIHATADNLKAIRRQILTQLETERLQVLEAQKKKISVSTSEVDKAINNILQDNHLTMEQVKNLLANARVDMGTFRSQIAAQIAWTKTVQDEYGDRVTVSPEDVDAEMKRVAAGANRPHFRVAEIFEAVDSPEQEHAGAGRADPWRRSVRCGCSSVQPKPDGCVWWRSRSRAGRSVGAGTQYCAGKDAFRRDRRTDQGLRRILSARAPHAV
jgi:peptidyl-prolyl cis-trans isomerase SurA